MAEPAALSSSKASSMAARKFDAKVEELLDQMLACLALCEIPSLSFCSPSSSLSVSPPIPVMFAKRKHAENDPFVSDAATKAKKFAQRTRMPFKASREE
ncbi:uncharacterized protein [Arachis hypogaea]|uniref:uncharacterized protein isoform X2 n=1 Tax=Arachis hypogaea TaxID=3818 RepID=UPI003B227C17